MPETPSRPAEPAGSLISIRGARQNNLRGVDVDFEPGTFTVITGPSGSGKSSLAFDTLYAEGQRRYVETFSPYARQFLDRCDRPKVDRIDGVPPAIAINQNSTVRTSRSTVGTMTELNDHFKLLFAREARLYCRSCGREVRVMTAQEMWEDIRARAAAAGDPRLAVTFDVRIPEKITREEALAALSAQGYTRIHAERKAGSRLVLTVTADRFRASRTARARGVEAVEHALDAGKGEEAGRFAVRADIPEKGEEVWRYAEGRTCADCGIHYSEPSQARFSFNSAAGACEKCRGFGRTIGLDWELIIPDDSKTLKGSCIRPWQGSGAASQCRKEMLKYAARDGISVTTPWKLMSEDDRNWVIEGEPGWTGDWENQWYGVKRYFEYLESKSYQMPVRVLLSRYRSYTTCEACGGSRLKPESLLWRVGSFEAAEEALAAAGGHGAYRRFVPSPMAARPRLVQKLPGLTLHDVMLLPVSRLTRFCSRLKDEIRDEPGQLVIGEILSRLSYLTDVGVGYLTLDRQSRTLSGGEVQRVNLTTALGTRLTDTLFVLDEPSIGLHPRDIDRVNAIMRNLRDAGNTLVVVEHDPQVMLAADRIIEMGPGAGESGGRIVYDGPARGLRTADTITGRYLRGALTAAGRMSGFRPKFQRALQLTGVTEHNLKDISVKFPLNSIVTVTGVSGSGKSTLVADVLVPALERKLGRAATAGAYASLRGEKSISDVSFVDQSAIGKTTRSNPVMYVGAFSAIRGLFAATRAAQERGYYAADFSFNAGNGRCPTCQGAGFEVVEMQFLSDVYLRCPDCGGRRYRPEILEVKITAGGREMNIADVLDLTVSEATGVFAGHSEITWPLGILEDVGLGYLKLGQSVSTLSGGEAQRLKLAGILAGDTDYTWRGLTRLYVFDEPTTGLAFDDISKLMHVLRRLVNSGGSVIVIEHNLDVIGASDWIIDLGPGGGEDGGRVVAEGTPEEVMENPASFTGQALAAYRRTFEEKGFTMQGLFPAEKPPAVHHGRPMQSVWRRARRGDLGIFGARENNLKDIDVVIPKKKLSVVTGVSGSGKSTLAFGVIFSEGQRRYLESLNAYARSLVQPGAKADVERVEGISPTVAIEQRTSRGGRKSTVATLTEVHHFLRLLYVKLGVMHCPDCGIAVHQQTEEKIADDIMKRFGGRRITIAAPLVTARKGVYTDLAREAARKGIRALRVDGAWTPTRSFPILSRYSDHTIEMPVISARFLPTPQDRASLRSAVRSALESGHGVMTVLTGQFVQTYAPKKEPAERVIYSTKFACPKCGRSFPEPDPRLFSYNSKIGWCPECFGTGRVIKGFDGEQTGEEAAWAGEDGGVCPACGGMRLNPVARAVRFEGRSICETTAMSVDDCLAAMESISLTGRDRAVGEDALKEIISRLKFLRDTGLGYIGLDRDAPSLSGGEAQRIRLASQLGSNLQGVCYVLDEPTIGLHPTDNRRLISCLKGLRDKGNTVIVVEHDEETIRAADHIVDIGPGAGSEGGRMVVEGTIEEVMAEPESVTGTCLKKPQEHSGRSRRAPAAEAARLTVKGASLHNLRSISPSFPLGRLIAITGVSGSGKSTLAREVLLPSLFSAVAARRKGGTAELSGCEGLEGAEHIDRVLEVDQTPIGKTPRSCPATYVGFFNQVRDLYASAPEALERGWNASRFSFNTEEGRCPVCAGQGQVKVEMNFLPDVRMTCEACGGMRFDEETLSVKWRGLSIGDVLNLPVDSALEVFSSSPRIAGPLKLLHDVGLGYLRLGQPSSTLSGGEAQRIKLVTELAKADTTDLRRVRRMPKTFYVLDEPTVGLHMADTEKLINVLHRLVDAGNTVLVVEHNLDVIAEADWVIDLGPGGGPAGGAIAAEGEPADVARTQTPTGRALDEFLAGHGCGS